MRQKKSEKIYAFIDSNNLHLGVLSQGWKLDFVKFRKYLRAKYNVEKAYLFIGHVIGNEALYTLLQEAGYILIFKPTLEYKRGDRAYTKGNVDAELVLHTMIEYPNYDKAIIVSGDGDFHCLLEYLVTNSKLAKLIIPNQYRFSALLRKFSQHTTFVNLFRKKVEIRSRR